MKHTDIQSKTTEEIHRVIDIFAESETKSLELLNMACNDVLSHVTLHTEPSLMNKLVRSAKTANKKLVIEFFKEHSIFKFNNELEQFGKKKDKEQLQAVIESCEKFYDKYNQDVMAWYNDNVRVARPKTPMLEQVMNKINKGLKNNELDPRELVQVLINNDKMLEAIFECIEEKQ